MEFEMIRKLIGKLNDSVKEMKTLYDISEVELILVTKMVMISRYLEASPKLTAKIMKAAAFIIESSDEIQDNFIKEMKNDKP